MYMYSWCMCMPVWLVLVQGYMSLDGSEKPSERALHLSQDGINNKQGIYYLQVRSSCKKNVLGCGCEHASMQK